MKKLITTLFTLIFLTSINSYADEQNHQDHDMNKEEIIIRSGSIDPNGMLLKVAVEGMVCDFCAQAIEKVFLKKDEVVGITVDLDNQNVLIALKEDTNISDDAVEELFINAGYNVAEINREKL